MTLPNAGDLSCPHDHCFFSVNHRGNEYRIWIVIGLTVATMLVEIISGLVFGSMALLADGWHMASHASAMGLTAMAYFLARKYRHNSRFTFGTGKINELAAFSSALLLVLIALLIAYESVRRLVNPVAIHFNEAIIVAVIGLVVNLISAFILNETHHDHGMDEHKEHNQDRNLRAAYFHVLADALTSILAIAALTIGKFWGLTFLDPVMGIIGAVVISRWSYNLLRDTGQVLLDYNSDDTLITTIRDALNHNGDVRVDDLHIWHLGPGHRGAIVSLTTDSHKTPEEFKQRLCRIPSLSHVTVEVNMAP